MRHLDILYGSSSRSFVEPFAWHTQAHVARGYFGPAPKSYYPTVEDQTAAGAHLTNVPPRVACTGRDNSRTVRTTEAASVS